MKRARWIVMVCCVVGFSSVGENLTSISLMACASGEEHALGPQQVVEVEFEGMVLERLKSPGLWAGGITASQGVRIRVKKVLEGPLKKGDIVVNFYLLEGSSLCEEVPELSKKIFCVGHVLRVEGKSRIDADQKAVLMIGDCPNVNVVKRAKGRSTKI